MDQYVVFGNPIGHSKSPLIHRLFADQTGQQLEYNTLLAPLDDFSMCALGFFKQGSGANVFSLNKNEIFAACLHFSIYFPFKFSAIWLTTCYIRM